MDVYNINRNPLQDIPDNDLEDHVKLFALLKNSPLLEDLEEQTKITDVERLIALEEGRAFSLTIIKFTGESFNVIVDKKGTVYDLKLAIKDKTIRSEYYKTHENRISWKYVWTKYSLQTEKKCTLSDDKLLLTTYGVNDLDKIYFIIKPYIKRIKRPKVPRMNKKSKLNQIQDW